eukprot:gene1813-33232_t
MVPSLASYLDEVIVVLYCLAEGFEPSKPNSNTDKSLAPTSRTLTPSFHVETKVRYQRVSHHISYSEHVAFVAASYLSIAAVCLGDAVEPPPPENTILPPRPPTPPSAGGGGVTLSRGSFRAFFLNNFATDPVPAEDATIAIARAFRVPEDRLPLPDGVLIRDIRATTAGDIAGDTNASFVGGTLIDFDSSYPLMFDLPNSISVVSAWEADITVLIAQGKVSTFSSNMFFLWPNGWFYAKYGISYLKGVLISGFPPPASPWHPKLKGSPYKWLSSAGYPRYSGTSCSSPRGSRGTSAPARTPSNAISTSSSPISPWS